MSFFITTVLFICVNLKVITYTGRKCLNLRLDSACIPQQLCWLLPVIVQVAKSFWLHQVFLYFYTHEIIIHSKMFLISYLEVECIPSFFHVWVCAPVQMWKPENDTLVSVFFLWVPRMNSGNPCTASAKCPCPHTLLFQRSWNFWKILPVGKLR